MKIKKAKKTQPVAATARNFDVGQFLKGINDKYGVGSIFRASDGVGMTIKYLRTGAYRLDFALGGGIPQSRMIEIFGGESAGKTTLILSCIAQFQRKYPEGVAALVDYERSFDPSYATLLGVDLDRLLVVNPDDGEQGADMLNDIVQAKTDLFVGVDSIAAMTPSSTLEVSAEKAEVGTQARLVNRLMAKCNARMKRNLVEEDYPTTTVIFSNQLREKVGVMFGNPETTPGGKGKNFFTSVRIRLSSSGSNDNKIEVPTTVGGVKKDVLVARVIKFSIVKNKTGGTPFEDGEFKYFIKPYRGYPAWSFDNEDALFEFGRFHGVIKVTGGNHFTYGKISTKQPHKFVQDLRADPDIAEELYQEIMVKVREFNSGTATTTADEVEEVE
jgi:recombination protein RecA